MALIRIEKETPSFQEQYCRHRDLLPIYYCRKNAVFNVSGVIVSHAISPHREADIAAYDEANGIIASATTIGGSLYPCRTATCR